LARAGAARDHVPKLPPRSEAACSHFKCPAIRTDAAPQKVAFGSVTNSCWVTLLVVKCRRLPPACLLALSFVACHAEVRSGPTTPASPTATAQASPAAEPEWVVAFARETNASMRMWGLEKDGSRRVATGSFRLVDRRGSIEVAPDLLASDIYNVFEFRDRFYFITVEGDIFRADSFLGALVDVGAAVGRGSLASRVRNDSVLISDHDQVLWSFDGQTTKKIDAPGPVSGVWVAKDGSPLVDICGRWFAIDSANRFSPARPGSDANDEGTGESEEKVQTTIADIRERLTSQRAGPYRAVLALDYLLAVAGGSLIPAKKVLPFVSGDACEVEYAGREPLVVCLPSTRDAPDDEASHPGVVYRVSAIGNAERWLEIPSYEAPVVGPGPSLFVRDQTGDVWIHAGHRDELSLGISDSLPDCASPDGNRDATVLGMSGSRLLVLLSCEDEMSFQVVDLSELVQDRRHAVAPLTSFLPAGARILDVTLSADQSTLSVVIRGSDGKTGVARGELGEKLSVHALPEGAKAAAFVDARRGMAIGDHLGQVWSTTDGALEWVRLVVPIEGDPAAVPLTHPPTCNLVSCSSDTLVVWADPRALRETGYQPERLMAPKHVPANRTFAGPSPRHESRFPRGRRDDTLPGCPKATPPKRNQPEQDVGLGNFGRVGH
jgi:hypothetical protein